MQRSAVLLLQKARQSWRLTIVGGDRVRRALDSALLGGPSTSPLERSMARQQAPVAAMILGVALAVGLRYGRDELHKHLIAPNGVVPNWYPFITSPIYALVELAPGFVSGWVASRRELLCGFLVGLFGAALYSAAFGTRSTAAGGISELFFLLGWLVSISVSAGLFGAAGAAIAKLLRSNNRWRGP
jgi:hypothetical protein